jgi:hypothetical protein
MTHRLTLTGALTAAALVLIATAEGAATHSTLTAAIATASSTDFRAELVARRSSGGSAPTATVTLTTFERNGSVWRKLTSKRLDGSFFWKTVSSPRAICRFELASARLRQAGHRAAAVPLAGGRSERRWPVRFASA